VKNKRITNGMQDNQKKLCGAKLRGKDARCQVAILMRNGRCRIHGGKSLGGWAHPNYKHGYYSKSPLDEWLWLGNRDSDIRREEKRRERLEKKIEQAVKEDRERIERRMKMIEKGGGKPF
jgi:hypothetical protein